MFGRATIALGIGPHSSYHSVLDDTMKHCMKNAGVTVVTTLFDSFRNKQ